MIKDKYSAVWVSHSSMGDYLKCPRAYYLNNVYRDPKTNHKISLIQPALALGQVVHETLDSISTLPSSDRFIKPLTEVYESFWHRVSGKNGGFHSEDEETRYRNRGQLMIERVMKHPGPILTKAVKIRQELPYYWLSEEDNIILCGKIDWLEYIEVTDSVRILDFKTGKFDEDPNSLQLPIYHLLVSNTQNRPCVGARYWYLDRDDEPTDVILPPLDEAKTVVLDIAKRVALARKLERFVCPHKDGCVACRPLEAIISGKATFVGVDAYNQDIYTL